MKILALLLFLLVSSTAQAAPKSELWDYWQANDANSTVVVDHSSWDDLLARYVQEGSGAKSGIALFQYAAVSAADLKTLRQYLQQLAEVPVRQLSRAEQQAYWINLYNALTVEVILSNYPLASIRDISSGFFSSGPWGEKRFQVDGENVSLDEIEHRILRPIWQDARLHYAVNCASIGCPNLAASAYTADNTDELLTAGAFAYVNHSRGAAVVDGELTVSSIYDWFQEDFGGNEAGVIEHLKQYAEDNLAEQLAQVTTVANYQYDWSLNEVK